MPSDNKSPDPASAWPVLLFLILALLTVGLAVPPSKGDWRGHILACISLVAIVGGSYFLVTAVIWLVAHVRIGVV